MPVIICPLRTAYQKKSDVQEFLHAAEQLALQLSHFASFALLEFATSNAGFSVQVSSIALIFSSNFSDKENMLITSFFHYY